MVANALMHNILKGQDTFFFFFFPMKVSIYGVYSVFDVGET